MSGEQEGGIRERFCVNCYASVGPSSDICWRCGKKEIKSQPAPELGSPIEPSVKLCQRTFRAHYGAEAMESACFPNGYKEQASGSIKG